MTSQIVVIGAGGFGREVIDVIDAINSRSPRSIWDLRGVVDDSPTSANLDLLAARRIEHLGDLDDLTACEVRPNYVIGIGNPGARRQIARSLDAAGFSAATLVHPDATLGSHVNLGAGSVVCAGARLTTNIQVGRHGHINLNATVGHDSIVGEFVSMNPLSSVSGDCIIEDDVTLGVSSSVINQVRIGRGSTVGGGACVVRDVGPNLTVVGVPAKPLLRRITR